MACLGSSEAAQLIYTKNISWPPECLASSEDCACMPSETDCCTFQILDLETSHAPSVATAAGYLLCYHIARSQVALKGNRHRVQRTDGISEITEHRLDSGFTS
jgi:hypothetical protein